VRSTVLTAPVLQGKDSGANVRIAAGIIAGLCVFPLGLMIAYIFRHSADKNHPLAQVMSDHPDLFEGPWPSTVENSAVNCRVLCAARRGSFFYDCTLLKEYIDSTDAV
jgi:hypothetical protein